MMRVGLERGSKYGRSMLESQNYLDLYMSLANAQQLRSCFFVNISKKCEMIARAHTDADEIIYKLSSAIKSDYRKNFSPNEAADNVISRKIL